jgi:uncharacterized protein involved in oxidation of intracellular sulfur
MPQAILIILGNPPYDGTDAAWNALRLVGQLHKDGVTVRLFLMNDAVDLARESIKPPDGYFDLVQIVKELISAGIAVRVCSTCQGRCGIARGEPYYKGANKSSMVELSEWVRTSDQVLTF